MSRVTVNVEGGLIPDDLLEKIADGSAPGQRAADFGVSSGRLSDEIMRAFSDAQSYWTAFKHRYERASKSGRESITTVTRDGFIIPLLAALGYSLEFRRSLAAGEQSFNISHTAGEEPSAPPVNIVSADESLDERGAGRRSAHSAVQEYLNLSDCVWGLVSNGHKLRLIRNSSRIARPRYIEFDLAGMMESKVYSDFHLLYRLLHRTRLPRSAADSAECWLSKYYEQGVEQGSRVRDRLRDGVVEALKIFGNAFLIHAQSDYLRGQIAANQLSAADYYRELLRLVYRLLFLMVAEERRLMFPDSRDDQARRAIFSEHYGVNRLRARIESYRGDDPEIDLWEGLKQTFRILRDDRAARQLGMAALNGELFGPHGCPHLDGGGDAARSAFCRNDDLLSAIDRLSKFDDEGVRRRVNFAALDVEELGSVYESLLEYHPQITSPLTPLPSGEGHRMGSPLIPLPSGEGHRMGFDLAWGSERKSTGSYYTPPDPVRELINSALVPVMEERLKAAEESARKNVCHSERSPRSEESRIRNSSGAPQNDRKLPEELRQAREQAILSMRVIDPAAGSGHFLLAAARRMGRELAKIRTGEEEPSPSFFRHAVRDVIRECIYAVDKNPLAVDLCKVALWIEGHNAGQPLSFLDHHVKCGDSLVGVFDLKVLEEGIPDDAYKAVAVDDKAAAKHYRALNREAKKNRPTIPQFKLPDKVTAALEALSHRDERTPEDVAEKEREYATLINSPAMQNLEHACNAWTAAFFVPLRMPEYRGRDLVPTSATVWERLSGRQIYGPLDGEIAKARLAYSFLHWPVEFADVFARGGFDVVLGNPPWERIKLQEKEFFASRDPDIARAVNKAAREKLIKTLPERKPELAGEWTIAVHGAEAQSKFVRESGRFPLCGRGDVNTYSIFAELARRLPGKNGRAGIIVPSGIATDDTTKFFFRDLMESRSLASLYSFENEEKIFPAVHNETKFCLLTIGSRLNSTAAPRFVFFARRVEQLHESGRRFTLLPEDIALLNPNTRTCPIFRTRRDAEITKAIYRRVPVLIKEGPPEENPWGIQFMRMFDMSNDSHLFRTREQLERDGWQLDGNIFRKGRDSWLPLYEGKMIWQFDHRYGTYEGQTEAQANKGLLPQSSEQEHADPDFSPLPRYWLAADEVRRASIQANLQADSHIIFRDITNAVVFRTAIFCVIPPFAVGHSAPLISLTLADGSESACFLACLNSFCIDYLARQNVGGSHLTYFILKQLPILTPKSFKVPAPWCRAAATSDWIAERALELTFTARDVQGFARAVGYGGPPFRWDEERRFLIRCELDAAFFHLYGISHDDADYIMETFPIVRRKDEERFGEYRTKRVILEIYDEMEQAKQSGRPYQTRLDPPPGDPRAADPRVEEESTLKTKLEAASASVHGPEAEKPDPSGRKKTPDRFKQAAIFAWTVQELYSPGHPVSRFRAGKIIYLIERALELHLFRNYLKQAAGPYDPTLRYGGAEGIAVRRLKWLSVTDASHFVPGPNISQVKRYVSKYIDIVQASSVINEFRNYQDEALERWTTIDMAARELALTGKSVTAQNILGYIESIPEWRHKVGREQFSPERVAKSLDGLKMLGFLSGYHFGPMDNDVVD
jgi:hypothetical protein